MKIDNVFGRYKCMSATGAVGGRIAKQVRQERVSQSSEVSQAH
jgi:hypothetical protein